jgi:hypothetical protein
MQKHYKSSSKEARKISLILHKTKFYDDWEPWVKVQNDVFDIFEKV